MQKLPKTDPMSQALAEPSRRALLEHLRFGPKSVTELVLATNLKQPNVSNHLAKMRAQGLVRSERIGRQVYYALDAPVAEVMLRLHELTDDPRTAIPASLRPAPEMAASNGAQGRAAEPIETGLPANSEADAPSLVTWQNTYFHSLLEGQENHAVALVNAMLAQRLDLQTIYEVFQWSLHRVGEYYEQGLMDVAQEHLASAITERMMARVAQFYAPVIRSGRRAVLGCVAGNWHRLGLRMLSDGLRELGWETLFLGANVPTDSFVALVITTHPDLVVISCSQEAQETEIRNLLTQLEAARREHAKLHFQIALGGHYYNLHPERLPEIGIDFTAPDLAYFLQTVRERLPASPHRPPSPSR